MLYRKNKFLRKFVSLMVVIGIAKSTSVSVVVSRPPMKYMEEGARGTIAACYQSTTDTTTGKESISLIIGNITWYWVNTTTSILLPTSNTQSNIWSNGFILSGTDVKLQNSGKYCCVVGHAGSCTEDSTTQLIVTAPPKLTISDPVVTATQGNFAQLTCNFVAPVTIPIRVQWYQNSTLLFTREKYSYITIQQNHSYTLVIQNLTNDDQGDYYCKADSNLNIPKTVGLISLIVLPMSVGTNSNRTTDHTDSPINNSSSIQPQNKSIITIILAFPNGAECLNTDSTGLDNEFQTTIMSICECKIFSVTRISLQCVNSSQASYTLLLIGPEVFAAAAALNHSINNVEYLTTESGIQFRLHPSCGHNDTNILITSMSNDDSNIRIGIFISITTILCLVIGVLLVALVIIMWWRHKYQTDYNSKENLNMITNQRTSMQSSAGEKTAAYYSTTV
ncbi:uncharacterized protein [Dysidea avara]|uniref:uncharacterized protein isoform X2 n=1 Tax=Dysidea avara TaxID=196820 RepID=UPI00332A4794